MGWMSTLINYNDEKGVTKGNVINCLRVMCWERFEDLLNHRWGDIIFLLLRIVQCYEHGHLLIICVNMSFALVLRYGCDKYYVIRLCIISRDVSRAAMDTIFRGTYHAPRWLLLSRVMSCAVTDAWTDMSPMGPGLRNSGCVSLGQTCIIILNIAFHYIAHTYH